tara:strand:- start:1189 stop:2031 length:843 start_codon:yes stop_codon:yes gene_type:complete
MPYRVTINTSAENAGPTIEESLASLQEEGVIPNENAEAEESQGASQGEESGEGGEDRPSWLPEKFKSPEDMAKSYAELEKKMSKGEASEGEPEDNSENTDATSDDPDGGEAREAVEAAGLDFDALRSEFDETQDLSEESRAKLEAAGIPKEYVDNYLAGVKAQTSLYEGSVKQIAGGEEGYSNLLAWGEANLSDEEIETFDAAVNSGNLSVAKTAVEGLQARMKLAQGDAPTRQVEGKSTSGSDVYESYAQMEADMNDPRYETDEAFRKKVYDKLARSNF